MKTPSLYHHLFHVAGSAALLSASLHAQSLWTESGGGEFTDAGNWSTVAAPGPGSTAVYSNNATGTITFASDVEVAELHFNNTSGALTLDLEGRKLTVANWFRLGNTAGPNNLIFEGGDIEFASVQNDAASTGNTFTFDGTTLTGLAEATQRLRIRGSDNTFTFMNGASYNMNEPAQQTEIGGSGGAGNLLIVTGSGSSFNLVGPLQIGLFANSDDNILRIENGASGSNTHVTNIGLRQGAEGNRLEVTGAGSSFINEAAVYIGGEHATQGAVNNVLRVANGGSFEVQDDLWVGGVSSDATGNKLEVDGGSVSITSGGALLVGTNSTGNEVVFNSGLIEAGSANAIIGSAFEIGDGGADTAVYRLLDGSGTHSFADGVTLNTNARLEGAGILDADVTLSGPGVQVSVGTDDSFGVLEIKSNWDNTNAEIILSIGDLSTNFATAGDNHDLLVLDGAINAGGTLFIDLDEFTAPSGMLTFPVVNWDIMFGQDTDFTVIFSEPSAFLSYQFENDGFYLTAIPEPRLFALLAGLLAVSCAALRRRRHG